MSGSLLILDADGVFLDERPYWEAALRAALAINAMHVSKADGWEHLSREAFEKVGLQRVTKRRGCNSNWDLGAVLALALSKSTARSQIQDALRRQRWREAVESLYQSADDLWCADDARVTARHSSLDDPLSGFGLDRHGAYYRRQREMFQSVLFGDSKGNSLPDIWRLRGSEASIREAFSALRRDGLELAICTGRSRTELLAPLNAFNLAEFFNNKLLITADDVAQAEHDAGIKHLGKPHWYPIACAVMDRMAALDAVLMDQTPPRVTMSVTYVGDALADFRSVGGARAVGLPVNYIHVRSGVTDAAQEESIASAPFTLAVVDELESVPAILRPTPVRSSS